MKPWEHPLAMVGAGVVLLVFGVYMGVQGERSRNWPTVPGVVAESEVVRYRTGPTDRRRSSSARITYRYVVDGKTYLAHRTSYFKDFFDGAIMEVGRYPQGSWVTVHYHPGDPATAVLDPGAGLASGLAVLAGIGCFSYAFWRARMA
jgi:hypothetical protein